MWLFGLFILGELGNNSFITYKPVPSKQWTSVAPAKRLYYTHTTGAALVCVAYYIVTLWNKYGKLSYECNKTSKYYVESVEVQYFHHQPFQNNESDLWKPFLSIFIIYVRENGCLGFSTTSNSKT